MYKRNQGGGACKHSLQRRGHLKGAESQLCLKKVMKEVRCLLVGLYVSVFTSQLLILASSSNQDSTHSQQEIQNDVICTKLTLASRSIHTPGRAGYRTESSLVFNDGETTVHVCRNLDKEFSANLFCVMILSRNRGSAVCLTEALRKWSTHCSTKFKFSSYTYEYTNMSPITKGPSYVRGANRSTTRYVDFLFLIERPEWGIDTNRSDQLAKAVVSLAKATHTNTTNIDARFSFVWYSLEDEYYIDALEFSSDIREFLDELADGHSEEFVKHHSSDPKLLHYLSVEASLKQIAKFLKLSENQLKVQMLNGQAEVTLSHRSHADLHILSFMDLSSKDLGAQSENIKENWRETETLIDNAKENIEERITEIIQLGSISEHPTSVHFFFSPSNPAARTYLGDPRYSVHYSDCSHFNKALTLKALLSSGKKGQADSLLAHMLSKGVETQVHSLDDLLKKNCILGVTPALSTPSGLQYKFSNVCQESTCFRSGPGYYCSPLHGWMKDDKSSRKNSTLFEGKTPLSSQFMASHADLLKPATSHTEGMNDMADDSMLPQVELTVDKELEGAGEKRRFEPVIEGQPRIVQWSPDKPFIEKMIAKRKSTVLKNTVVKTWPAQKKWTLSYIEKNMGTDILPSVKCTNTYLTFDPDKRTPLKLNISLPFTLVNMTTEAFFKCIQRDSSNPICSDGYKGHYYFGSVPDSLRDDVMPDNLLYNTERDYKARKQFMWISSAGMITHTHFDQDYNFFVQLVGKKRFTLWSPLQHELMYVYPRVHPMWHKSRVNYRAVDLEKFPAFSQARGKQIELGPGDMLFVPPYTWHYVETLTPSVSLSTWSHDYELYDHMNSIYRHDHKFDLLEDQRGE